MGFSFGGLLLCCARVLKGGFVLAGASGLGVPRSGAFAAATAAAAAGCSHTVTRYPGSYSSTYRYQAMRHVSMQLQLLYPPHHQLFVDKRRVSSCPTKSKAMRIFAVVVACGILTVSNAGNPFTSDVVVS